MNLAVTSTAHATATSEVHIPMMIQLELTQEEADGIASLATVLETTPDKVAKALIRNALGFGFKPGSMSDRLHDFCPEMSEGVLPGVEPDHTVWNTQSEDTFHPLISINEVAQRLRLSISMIRKRQRNPMDPLRRARSRLGKKRPMQFDRAKIVALERQLG